ncbi:MAG: acyl-CoA dehydrogenase [Caldiserica bacterium]|nr:MAG: acyl-CoA dehydrogenase [Caldisericota bacterium]
MENEVLTATHDFCKKYIQPYEKEIDFDSKFVKEILKEFSSHGFMALPFPKKYGGLEQSTILYSKTATIISQYSGTIASILGAHCLAAFSVLFGGGEEQKEKYLPDLIKGRLIGSFALTEQNAGSDPASIETEAIRDGNFYVLNGTKAFTTNAGLSDLYVIMAKTDKERGARGISAFIVEREDKNFVIGRQEKKMALPGLPNASLLLNGVRIPKERLLGREGMGFIIVKKVLDVGRIAAASAAVGLAKRALIESVRYSKQREQFGKPISAFEMIQSHIADMGTKVEAAELLTLKAAEAADQKQRDAAKIAAMAKYFAAQVAVDVSRLAVQIFGGYGFIQDYVVERLYKEAKMYEIIEGTNEIQKLIIANALLKEME